MKKIILGLGLLCANIAGSPCLGQEKLFTLKLNIQNKETKEAVAFANVRVFGDSNRLVRNAISDINGKIKFKLKAGKYDFVANSAGFKKYRLLKVSIPKTKEITIDFVEEATTMEAVEIKAFKKPLIGVSNGECQRLSSEQITKIPTRNPSELVATYSNVRGNRNGKTDLTIPVLESKAYQADVSGEGYKKISENPFLKTSRNPLSTFSIDVDRASYTNIRRFLNSGSLPPPEAVRLEEMVNYFTYDYSTSNGNEPFSVKMEYTQCPWNPKHDLVHIGIQGKKVRKEKMPPNNLVFLVDVSGSMDEPNKLPLVKSCLHMLVNQMRPEDKIALVVYAGAAGLVLPSTSGDNKIKISEAIDGLSAGGSTAGGEGIVLAYAIARENFLQEGNNRVLLATDGDFNVGVSDDSELEKLIEDKRKEKVYLSVLGFGTGNYKDSKMEILADKGNGNYAYIDNMLEGQKVLVNEMTGTLLTIAKDVKIQVEFNPDKVKKYRLLGYENRALEDSDFNNDQKDAGELGAGNTVTALYEIIPEGSSGPDTGAESDSIDALKYTSFQTISSNLPEILTLKLRYKEPKDSTSRLITKVLQHGRVPISKASENCRFAASVAEFGLLLKDSGYKADSDFSDVLSLAESSKGEDKFGYRSEFIRLVSLAKGMK